MMESRTMRWMAALCVVAALGACTKIVPGTPAASGVGYAVFFNAWSADLDDGARASIVSAARSALAHPAVPILVEGFAANDVGTVPANIALAHTRALKVRDQLILDGVDPTRIREVNLGPVGYALDPVEARRVTIRVGQS
jgi:outer membrane protein OmpA-like peptidoglycan-associated protein